MQITLMDMIKKILIILVIIIGIAGIAMMGLKVYTKSFSPLEVAIYQDNNQKIEVVYCRPYKKNRTVFPDLIPYDEVWRTGANEATTITTTQDLTINNKTLPKGTYSLWTMPRRDHWEIIFNKEYGQWGVKFWNAKANREALLDVLSVTVPVYQTSNNIEQFTIQFEAREEVIEMLLMWDHTIVIVPIKKINSTSS